MKLVLAFWIFAFCAFFIKASEEEQGDPVLRLLKSNVYQKKVDIYVDDAIKYLGETHVKITSESNKILNSLSSNNGKELTKIASEIQKTDNKLNTLRRHDEISKACVEIGKPALPETSEQAVNNALFCSTKQVEELTNTQKNANELLETLQNNADNLRTALNICDNLEGKRITECINDQLKEVKKTVSSIKLSALNQYINFDKSGKNLENVQKSCIKYVSKELDAKLDYIVDSVQQCIKTGGPPTTPTTVSTETSSESTLPDSSSASLTTPDSTESSSDSTPPDSSSASPSTPVSTDSSSDSTPPESSSASPSTSVSTDISSASTPPESSSASPSTSVSTDSSSPSTPPESSSASPSTSVSTDISSASTQPESSSASPSTPVLTGSSLESSPPDSSTAPPPTSVSTESSSPPITCNSDPSQQITGTHFEDVKNRSKVKECIRLIWLALRNEDPTDVVNEAHLRVCSKKILQYIAEHGSE